MLRPEKKSATWFDMEVGIWHQRSHSTLAKSCPCPGTPSHPAQKGHNTGEGSTPCCVATSSPWCQHFPHVHPAPGSNGWLLVQEVPYGNKGVGAKVHRIGP